MPGWCHIGVCNTLFLLKDTVHVNQLWWKGLLPLQNILDFTSSFTNFTFIGSPHSCEKGWTGQNPCDVVIYPSIIIIISCYGPFYLNLVQSEMWQFIPCSISNVQEKWSCRCILTMHICDVKSILTPICVSHPLGSLMVVMAGRLGQCPVSWAHHNVSHCHISAWNILDCDFKQQWNKNIGHFQVFPIKHRPTSVVPEKYNYGSKI